MVRNLSAVLVLLAGGVAAAEIDVRGSWQVNLSCGAFATATTFFDLDENLATGEVTPLPPTDCGTIAFYSAPVAVVESCTATGEHGQVSGTSFTMPATGYATSEQVLQNPAYFDLANCVVARVVAQSQHTGTIIDGGTGTATRITGSLTNGSVYMYDVNDNLCWYFNVPITACSFDMRRNDVAAGTAVSVQPNARVSVTFDSVSTGGTASVTPLNDPTGEIPAAFQMLGGVLPIFYDVATTAAVSGAITTCYAYDDANGDGIVDGTQLSETSLQLLHEEEEVFVDRTSSIDPVNNVVCAETTSLSQLVPGAPTVNGPPPPGSFQDFPMSGIKLLLKRDDANVEKSTFITRDRNKIGNLTLSPLSDPRTLGATFEMFSAGEGTASFSLPAGGWIATTSGVLKYNGALVGGPVRKAVIKPLKAIVVKTSDTGVPLAGPQGTVSVRVTVGNVRYCSRFGPTTIVRDETDRFSAKGALAAALLGCSNAALGVSSPSGAFVD